MREPRFSVIVPTFNRPRQLDACLAALAAQRLGKDTLEVIVVDDGSDPPLGDLTADWVGRLRVTVLQQRQQGPGSARNRGVSSARGTYVAFVDDDCVPDPQWLTEIGAALDRGDVLAGGAIRNGLPDNRYATASHLITEYAYRYYAARPNARRFFTTNNMAVHRKSFEAMGGFDTSIPAATAEDKDLCDRWLDDGRELVHVPEATVLHAHDLGLRSFLRQHYRYGRGILCFRVIRRRRAPARPGPIRPEPWRFYLGLVVFPVRRLGGLRGWVAGALAALAQLATAAGAAHAVLFDLRRVSE